MMSATTSIPTTLLSRVHKAAGGASPATKITTVVFGTLFFTLCAKINVPVWPVPVTMQSFAIAAFVAAFGLRIGMASVSLYLLQGAAGLPVFAAGGGAAYLLGPTGGFLIGFVLMAAIIGFAVDRGAKGKFLPLFCSMIAGNVALLAFGFVGLVAFSGAAGWVDQTNVLGSAFAGAVQPFIVWEGIKMALAALTVAGMAKLLARA